MQANLTVGTEPQRNCYHVGLVNFFFQFRLVRLACKWKLHNDMYVGR